MCGRCLLLPSESLDYARERRVFGRPIGQNQGIQFPLAQAYAHARAADLMRWKAAELYDQGLPCGPEANMAKLLAADASWEAANAALQTFGALASPKSSPLSGSFGKRGSTRWLLFPLTLSWPTWAIRFLVFLSPTRSMRALEGITVVGLEQAVAAPLATRHLADLGARVIKVERPEGISLAPMTWRCGGFPVTSSG